MNVSAFQLGCDLPPGEVVDGRYRIESYLGGGGMASVYRAVHLALEQPVAIKILSPAVRALPGAAARFIREARAATLLKSANVVRVSDVGTLADGAPYMAMELLEGQDLDERLANGWRPTVPEAVGYVLQTCAALAEVHGLGIVHRDLKPANLFLTTGPDGRPLVKLIDFGISRVSPLEGTDAVQLTNPDAIMGSPRYMSPEAMESAANADARSDIWALGAILYELLTGSAPYDGDALVNIYAAALNGPPPAASAARHDVPTELDDVIARCLNIDPSQRFADVAELAVALAPFGGESALKEAEEVLRVLGVARRRSNSVEEAPDSLRVESELSRVQRRVSRITGAARRRRKRAAFVVATVSVVIGACAAVFVQRPAAVEGGWAYAKTTVASWSHRLANTGSAPPVPQESAPAVVTAVPAPTAVEDLPSTTPGGDTVRAAAGSSRVSAGVRTTSAPYVGRPSKREAHVPARPDESFGVEHAEPTANAFAPAVVPTEPVIGPALSGAPPAPSGALFEDRQ